MLTGIRPALRMLISPYIPVRNRVYIASFSITRARLPTVRACNQQKQLSPIAKAHIRAMSSNPSSPPPDARSRIQDDQKEISLFWSSGLDIQYRTSRYSWRRTSSTVAISLYLQKWNRIQRFTLGVDGYQLWSEFITLLVRSPHEVNARPKERNE